MDNNINGRKEEERFTTEENQDNRENTEEKMETVDENNIVEDETTDSVTADKEIEEGLEDKAGDNDETEGPATAELLDMIANLEKKLAEKETEMESLNNRLVRLQADFNNYRKRNEKETEKLQSTIVAGIMEELLPVLDNFDRALAQDGSGEDFRKGIEMIHRQLMDFLLKQGVENIEAVGKEFDHNYHNAVLQVETDEYESGVVVEELQKGYILNNDIVIRPSMVKVAK